MKAPTWYHTTNLFPCPSLGSRQSKYTITHDTLDLAIPTTPMYQEPPPLDMFKLLHYKNIWLESGRFASYSNVFLLNSLIK